MGGPVHLGGGEDGAEQVVGGGLAVEGPDEQLEVRTVAQVAPRVLADHVGPARRIPTPVGVGHPPAACSMAITAGKSTLFSLCTWRWVSASSWASPSYRAR